MSLAERPSRSMPEAPPEGDEDDAHPMRDPDFLNIDDDEKVEALLFRGWSVQRIARATGFRVDHVQQYVDELDADMIEQLQESPVKVKERQIRMLRGIVANVMTCDQVRENPKLYLIAMKAMADERKIKGYDAPVQSANFSVSLRGDMSQDQIEADFDDPEIRRHALAIEERQRQIQAEGHRKIPGVVRRAGERRLVGLQAPHRADEPGGMERDVGGDFPPVDQHASAGGEIGVLVEVVTGVLPGPLPRSEGAPG